MKKISVVLMLTGAFVFANWYPLKLMSAYSSRDFSLKEGVEYMEVKRVDIYSAYPRDVKEKVVESKSVQTVFQIYNKPLKSFGKKVASNFKRLPLSSKKRDSFLSGGAGHLGGTSSWYYNGFMLDSNLKSWRLENTQDIIDMVKPINTPAEIKLVMWANKYAEGFLTDSGGYRAKYKKVGKNYVVEERYSIENMAYGECGVYTYQSTIDSSGKLLKRKLLLKESALGCFTE